MRVGQPATVTRRHLSRHDFTGDGRQLGPSTGAEFAVLPPQNATGNWVKVVQRIPCDSISNAHRRATDDTPLRAGMSVVVDIDTEHHRVLPAFIQSAAAWVGVE